MVKTSLASGKLQGAIKNLVLEHRLFPAEGYEFPQDQVAEFWKDLFSEKGIQVFGLKEVPESVSVLSVDFKLPDQPPDWLIED